MDHMMPDNSIVNPWIGREASSMWKLWTAENDWLAFVNLPKDDDKIIDKPLDHINRDDQQS